MSTIFKFVFSSILKPVFIKFSIISFCIRSVLRLDIFLKSIHHPYTILHTLYQICLTLKIVYGCQKAHRFRHHQSCPWWSWSSFLYFLLSRLLSLYDKDFLQFFCLIFFCNVIVLLGKQDCIIWHFFWCRWVHFCNIQLGKFTLRFIFNWIKPLKDTVQNFLLIYLKKFYKILIHIFQDWFTDFIFAWFY